jgi:hypothetical protein
MVLAGASNRWVQKKGRQMRSYILAKASQVGNGRQRSANARKQGWQKRPAKARTERSVIKKNGQRSAQGRQSFDRQGRRWQLLDWERSAKLSNGLEFVVLETPGKDWPQAD